MDCVNTFKTWISSTWSRNNLGFLLTLYLLTFCQFRLFSHEVDQSLNLMMLLTSLFDSALIVFPFIFFAPKRGWWFYIWSGFWTIIMIINGAYRRNFDDTANLRTIFDYHNFNSFVISSGIDSLTWRSLVILLLWAASLGLWIVLCRRSKLSAFTRRFRWICTIVLSLGFVAVHAARIMKFQTLSVCIKQPESVGEAINAYACHGAWKANVDRMFFQGLVESYILELVNWPSEKINLSDDEKAAIRSRLARPLGDKVRPVPDGKGKNLILIVVESWANVSIGEKINGRSLTPTIDSILKRDDVIFASNLHTSCMVGTSSSGQFNILTGLLPLQDAPVTDRYSKLDYPSIPKALGSKYRSEEFIGETQSAWKQYETFSSYGFSEIYDNLIQAEGESVDDAIFKSSMQRIKEMSRPFFAMVTTLGMHGPFSKPSPEFRKSGFTDDENAYLEQVSNFDTALGTFLKQLRDAGLDENTVIVMTADHKPRKRMQSFSEADPEALPLIIIPAKQTDYQGFRFDTKMPQTVVYPTILDIMGVLEDYPYKGLGTSLFRVPTEKESELYPTSEVDWETSRKIIKGNYFPFKTTY